MVNSDPRIGDIQFWLNQTYGGKPGFQNAPDDGRTGWPTIQSMTTALQIEVGVPSAQISNAFGPLTQSLLTSKYGFIGPDTESKPGGYNIIQIVKGALYCKGYSGGSYDGKYSATVQQSVATMRSNMGFSDSRNTLSPQEFKALLSMDPYVLVLDGRADIREAQQWLNRQYVQESWFSIIPADGYFSRNVQRGLVYALQKELGVSAPTGSVGPATLASLKARSAIAVGTKDSGSSVFVRLFQAALRFNKYAGSFTGTFAQGDSTLVSQFQQFMRLPVTGKGDYQTWCALLISSGDTSRIGTACDTSTPLTAEKAAAVYGAGYRIVGRYLTNATTSGALNKKIQPGELAVLRAANLKIYPIFQTYGGSASYFNVAQGASDALSAISAARGYGFPRGTTIYFAIDFDATAADVTSSILPHFRGIKQQFDSSGNFYRLGVYGSRYPCSALQDEGLTSASMVLSMSNGYSGNLGFTMPTNWAWDQIATVSVGSGSGSVVIDKNVASGRDGGVTPPTEISGLDVPFPTGQTGALTAAVELAGNAATSKWKKLGVIANSINRVLSFDTQITAAARQFRLRKALIQTVATWEDWAVNPLDIVSDVVVEQSHAYRIAFAEALKNGTTPPVAPVPLAYDSSTGFAQIFGATAIKGRNLAIDQQLMSGTKLNPSLDSDIWIAWQKLKYDDNYTFATVPAVLLWGAADIKIGATPRVDYTDSQVQAILARYNGTNASAKEYGADTFRIYQAYEKFNKAARG